MLCLHGKLYCCSSLITWGTAYLGPRPAISRRGRQIFQLVSVCLSQEQGLWLRPAQLRKTTWWTCKRSPHGHMLRPVNTSTYAFTNVSSKYTFVFSFNSSIHTALAIQFRTRLQATTSIFCYMPSNHAHRAKSSGPYFRCCGTATDFRAHTQLKRLHKIFLPLSSRQIRQFPLLSCPRDQMTNLPGLTYHFYR